MPINITAFNLWKMSISIIPFLKILIYLIFKYVKKIWKKLQLIKIMVHGNYINLPVVINWINCKFDLVKDK